MTKSRQLAEEYCKMHFPNPTEAQISMLEHMILNNGEKCFNAAKATKLILSQGDHKDGVIKYPVFQDYNNEN